MESELVTDPLFERIADEADDIERARELTPAVLDGLHEAGAFRWLIPKKIGGMEVPFPKYLRAVERLAMADASTAWCVNQGAVIGTTTLWLSAATAETVWRDSRMAVANGPPLDCALEPTTGGVLATGHWGFSSGCRHARLMTGAARLPDGDWRMVFFPPEAAEFIDDWQVTGLRGTASFQFRLNAHFVADEWVADMSQPALESSAFYRIPTGLAFAVSFAALAVGLARRGIDEVVALALGKTPIYASRALRDDTTAQRLLGEAEATWRSARALLYTTVGEIDEALRHREIQETERVSLRIAGTHAIRCAADVMSQVRDVAGSSVIYHNHPLHRPLQDMQVITQHVQSRLQYYEGVGRFMLGHPYVYGPMG